jgi:hypothetical protein
MRRESDQGLRDLRSAEPQPTRPGQHARDAAPEPYEKGEAHGHRQHARDCAVVVTAQSLAALDHDGTVRVACIASSVAVIRASIRER